MQPQNSADHADTEHIVTAEIDYELEAQNEASRRSFIEQLLSPQSLQWMMACGSGLLMLGFVIWLWSVGIFENPVVVAVGAGAATLSLIAGGMAMILKTRHQLAGRWLTLLGAVAMPLNLWLYNAQGLIILDEGGHLWVPAAICCAIYALIAKVLRDSTFVYALVGGVVLTGMLFLADQSIGRFWEWLPPAKFLLAIGWISVFAERIFPNGKSEFSRSNFGAAFFRSGMIVVGSGLALIVGGFVSVIASAFIGQIDSFYMLTSITTHEKMWALGMISASAAGMFTQALMRKSQTCFAAAIGLVAVSIAITLNLLAIPMTGTLLASVIAALTIGVNVRQALTRSLNSDSDAAVNDLVPIYWSQVAVVGLLILAGFHIAIHFSGVSIPFLKPLSWWSVVQYLLTAAASWTVAWNTRESNPQNEFAEETATAFSVAGAITAMLTIWVGVWIQSVFAMQSLALIVSVVPVLVAVAALTLRKGSVSEALLGSTASTMTLAHLTLIGASSLNGSLALTSAVWAIVLGGAALAFFLASRKSATAMNEVLSLLSSIAGITVFANHLGFNIGHCLILAPMIAGTSIKVLHHFIGDHVESDGKLKQKPFAVAANFIISQAGIAAVLLGMSRWLSGDISGSLMAVMFVSLVCTVAASYLTKNQYWRSLFRTLILAIVGSSVCVFDGWLDMDGWHRGEVCSLVAGVALLVLGHLAWTREGEADADTVASVSLITGSLLVAIPLAIGLVSYRFVDDPATHWRLFHEVATIAGSLILLGSGMLCRIRVTTVSGAALMLTFVGSLVTLVRIPDQLQNASVAMMVGGGLFLGSAVLMSIYRDRLVALPTQMREGEGVFQVLKWR